MDGTPCIGRTLRMTPDEWGIILEPTDFEVSGPVEGVRWRPVFGVGDDGLARRQRVSAYQRDGHG
jgi:hypothetical protein